MFQHVGSSVIRLRSDLTRPTDLCPPFLSAPGETDVKKGQLLKEEGNALVKKGEHKKAIEKYSASLKHNPAEVTTYTNRWVNRMVEVPQNYDRMFMTRLLI